MREGAQIAGPALYSYIYQLLPHTVNSLADRCHNRRVRRVDQRSAVSRCCPRWRSCAAAKEYRRHKHQFYCHCKVKSTAIKKSVVKRISKFLLTNFGIVVLWYA